MNIKQIHFGRGDNVAGDKSCSDSRERKNNHQIPLWLQYLVALVTIIAAIWGIFNVRNSMNINQTHYGLGDNVAGNKNIINQYPAPRLVEQAVFLNKMESGKYHSKFLLEIISAPGIPLPKIGIAPQEIGNKCQIEKKSNGNAIKIIGGIQFSSISFFVNCLTDTPIQENELNFTLIGSNE